MQSTTSTRDTPVVINVDQLENLPWYRDSSIKIAGTALAQDEIQKIQGNRFPDALKYRDEVIRLIYLATIAEEGKSSYSDSELTIFRNSDTKATRAIVALWGGLSLSILLALAAFVGLTGGRDDLSNMDKAAIAVSVAVFCSLIINPLAYYATGFAPNASSNAFNEKQDITQRYAKTLSNSAKTLLALAYGTDDEQRLAQAIVQNIDMDAVKAKIAGPLKNPVRSEDVSDSLVQVVAFLKDGDLEHLKKESLRQFVLAKEPHDLETESF